MAGPPAWTARDIVRRRTSQQRMVGRPCLKTLTGSTVSSSPGATTPAEAWQQRSPSPGWSKRRPGRLPSRCRRPCRMGFCLAMDPPRGDATPQLPLAWGKPYRSPGSPALDPRCPHHLPRLLISSLRGTRARMRMKPRRMQRCWRTLTGSTRKCSLGAILHPEGQALQKLWIVLTCPRLHLCCRRVQLAPLPQMLQHRKPPRWPRRSRTRRPRSCMSSSKRHSGVLC